MIINNLSGEDYHNGKDYRRYISSTQLKHYAVSPAAARLAMAEPQEQTAAMAFGQLVHSAMEHLKDHDDLASFDSKLAVFTSPCNPKTGLPYGTATKAYADAYADFVKANKGKLIASIQEAGAVYNIAGNIATGNSCTAQQARYAIRHGQPEVSIMLDYEGVGFKVRPDLLCDDMIIDYKTTAATLEAGELDQVIRRYHYDISAAMYQWAVHEETGRWCSFYLLFLAKEPPYDALMVNVDEYAYHYDEAAGDWLAGPGAVAFEALRDLHIRCTKAEQWPGAEVYVPKAADGARIITAQPPMWYVMQTSAKYQNIPDL